MSSAMSWIYLLLLLMISVESAKPPLCTVRNTNIGFVCRIITFFHNVQENPRRPKVKKLRHCDFLRYTPHCCEQFCIPATGSGECEEESGVCRCKGEGKPELCNTYFEPKTPGTNDTILETCRQRCKEGSPNACTTPAYVVDGYNSMCLCYCQETKGNELYRN